MFFSSDFNTLNGQRIISKTCMECNKNAIHSLHFQKTRNLLGVGHKKRCSDLAEFNSNNYELNDDRIMKLFIITIIAHRSPPIEIFCLPATSDLAGPDKCNVRRERERKNLNAAKHAIEK